MGERLSQAVTEKTFLIAMVIAILGSTFLSVLTVSLIPIAQGPQGEQGPQGIQGPEGPQGPQGEPGLGVQPGFLVAPAYDSGWVPRDGSGWNIFEHWLNTTDVFVYVLKNDSVNGINSKTFSNSEIEWILLTEKTIVVRSAPVFNPTYEFVRVMIWKMAEPAG